MEGTWWSSLARVTSSVLISFSASLLWCTSRYFGLFLGTLKFFFQVAKISTNSDLCSFILFLFQSWQSWYFYYLSLLLFSCNIFRACYFIIVLHEWILLYKTLNRIPWFLLLAHQVESMWLLCYRISTSLLKNHPKNHSTTYSPLSSNNVHIIMST